MSEENQQFPNNLEDCWRLLKLNSNAEIKLKELQSALDSAQQQVKELQDQLQFYMDAYVEADQLKRIITQLETDMSKKENSQLELIRQQQLKQKRRISVQFSYEEIQRNQLVQQLKKTEESAIEVIMEKEKKIHELEEDIVKLTETLNQDQIMIINKQAQEIDDQKDQILKLNDYVEQILTRHADEFQKRENEWNERLVLAINEQTNESKTNQLLLLQKLQGLEEKYISTERTYSEKEREFNQKINESIEIISNLENRNYILTGQTQKQQEIIQSLQQENNTLDFQMKKQQHYSEDRIQRLHNQLQDSYKSCNNLKIQNQKMQNQIIDLTIQMEKLMQNKENLQNNIDLLKAQYEEQLNRIQYLNKSQMFNQEDQDDEIQNLKGSTLKEECIDDQEPDSFFEMNQYEYKTHDNPEKEEQFNKEIQMKNELIESYEMNLSMAQKQISELQDKLQLTIKEMQIMRKRFLIPDNAVKYRELLKANQELRNKIHQLEQHFSNQKLKWLGEVNFLKEEIHFLEKSVKSSNNLIQEITNERNQVYKLYKDLLNSKNGFFDAKSGILFSLLK